MKLREYEAKKVIREYGYLSRQDFSSGRLTNFLHISINWAITLS